MLFSLARTPLPAKTHRLASSICFVVCRFTVHPVLQSAVKNISTVGTIRKCCAVHSDHQFVACAVCTFCKCSGMLAPLCMSCLCTVARCSTSKAEAHSTACLVCWCIHISSVCCFVNMLIVACMYACPPAATASKLQSLGQLSCTCHLVIF